MSINLLIARDSAFASTFDPGPPGLPANLRASDEIFGGRVVRISSPESNERGDATLEIAVSDVWKGQVEPGTRVQVNVFRKCPFLVRRADCVRHTVPVEEGEAWVFFTKGQKPKFAGRAFGTRKYAEVAPALNALKAGKSIYWAEALLRSLGYRPQESEVVVGTVLKLPDTKNYEPEFSLKVELALNGSWKLNDVIQVVITDQYRNGFTVPSTFKVSPAKKIVLIRRTVRMAGGNLKSLNNPVLESEIQKKAAEIEAADKAAIGKHEYLRSGTKSAESNSSSWASSHWKAFKSIFYFFTHMGFYIGYEWNPDATVAQ